MVPQPKDASEQAAMAEYRFALIVATISKAGGMVWTGLVWFGLVRKRRLS